MREFEWDETKNAKNKIKHKVSFEDAKEVFKDDNRLQYAVDRNEERRYITIGKAFKVIITVVIANSLIKQDDEYDKEENHLG